ncbi:MULTISPECIES: hypothetical protein [unclassified Bradyrhizobium]|uniref:hypothetical protein n=1 Tax=unclassified Bradyrhizobium TaxID=2631580 RepID=UPI00339AB1B3
MFSDRQTQTTLPAPKLDVARASIILNVFELYELKSESEVANFAGALFVTTQGNPAVKSILLAAPYSWPDIDADALRRKFCAIWDLLDSLYSKDDWLDTLRTMCTQQSLPWPKRMIESVFDDPGFNAAAFLNCLGSSS